MSKCTLKYATPQYRSRRRITPLHTETRPCDESWICVLNEVLKMGDGNLLKLKTIELEALINQMLSQSTLVETLHLNSFFAFMKMQFDHGYTIDSLDVAFPGNGRPGHTLTEPTNKTLQSGSLDGVRLTSEASALCDLVMQYLTQLRSRRQTEMHTLGDLFTRPFQESIHEFVASHKEIRDDEDASIVKAITRTLCFNVVKFLDMGLFACVCIANYLFACVGPQSRVFCGGGLRALKRRHDSRPSGFCIYI